MCNKLKLDPVAETLRLARLAKWVARPNPAVGAFVLASSNVDAKSYVGRGCTHAVGGIHAEIHALNNLAHSLSGVSHSDNIAAQGHLLTKELYSSLAPCTFQGRTPPCVAAIIEAGIKTVHLGLRDNDPRMEDAVALLARAGVRACYDFPEKVLRELFWLNADYYYKQRTGMPFVTLKYALSLDGSIADERGSSKWITGEAARTDANLLRGQCDAVLIGARTFILDAPRLRTRLPESLQQELQAVYGATHTEEAQPLGETTKKTIVKATGFNCKEPRPFILLTRDFSKSECELLMKRLKHSNENTLQQPWFQKKNLGRKVVHGTEPVFLVQGDFTVAKQFLKNCEGITHLVQPDSFEQQTKFRELIRELGETYQLNSIFVEGGAHVASLFRWSGLIQRMVVYLAPKLLTDPGLTSERSLPPLLPVRSYLKALTSSVTTSEDIQDLATTPHQEKLFKPLAEVTLTNIDTDVRVMGYRDNYEVLRSLWKELKG